MKKYKNPIFWPGSTRQLLSLIGLVCYVLVQGGGVYAAVRSYNTLDKTITTGMVVAVSVQAGAAGAAPTSQKNTLVEKAAESKAQLTLGIVTDRADNLTYSAGEKDEILVANSGRVDAYVSDVNGAPAVGDLLAPSPLEGILMRATDGAKGIVGASVTSFAASATEAHTLQGGKVVHLATVVVDLDIRTAAKVTPGGNPLQNFMEKLAGHKVTIVQAFMALTIAMLTLVIIGSILYASTTHYLTALGRNPMARQQLNRGLLKIFAIAGGVLAMGILGGWVVLWL